MPYSNINDLPENVKHVLPKGAQEIYKEAFNNAVKQYSDKSKRNDPGESPEEIAFKVAWAAVKNKYEKGADDKWHLK